jgi:hypothetical protein
MFLLLRNILQLGAVIGTDNPRYSGGEDQEDGGLRTAWVKIP